MNDFCLIIISQNRIYYLKRLLEFYSKTNIKRIHIADSSSFHYPFEIPDGVSYSFDKGMTFVDKVEKALEKVKTKYVAICADDDFILEEGIKGCISFLEKNNSYVAVKGHQVEFNQDSNFASFTASNTQAPFTIDINAETILERINSYLSAYVPMFYGVFRTSILQQAFRISNHEYKEDTLMEMSTAIYPLFHGKYKILPIAYGASAQFANEELVKLKKNRNYCEIIKSENEVDKIDIQKFLEPLAKEFSRIEKVNYEKSFSELKSVLGKSYCGTFIPKYYKKIYKRNKIKEILKLFLIKIAFFSMFIKLKRIYIENKLYINKKYILYSNTEKEYHAFQEIEAQKEMRRMKLLIDSSPTLHRGIQNR